MTYEDVEFPNRKADSFNWKVTNNWGQGAYDEANSDGQHYYDTFESDNPSTEGYYSGIN